MTVVTLEDAQQRLPELIATTAPGEEVAITSGDRVVARLVTVEEEEKPRPKFGSAAGSILYMAPDFDEPLEDFKEYM
jgi:antitoxin (DNA-binding transcriptional repressor) of toxin-antitoxin stability system